MEFNFPRFDHVQSHYTPRANSSLSSLNYSYISGHPTNGGGGSFGGDHLMEIHREIEKERIREEIIAAENERQRALEAEVLRRELIRQRETMMLQSDGGYHSSFRLETPLRAHYHQYHPFKTEMLHGEWFTPDDTRRATPFPENYGRGCEIGGFEAVSSRGRPPSPMIKEGKTTGFIGLGKPSGAVSGSKRKAGLSPSPPAVLGSSGCSSNTSKKKVKEEWNCVVCGISMISKHDLNKHLSGRKHRDKMEASKSYNNSGPDIGSGKMKKQPSMCQVGPQDEKIMRSHKNGKKHRKNLLKKTRGKTKPAGRKRI